MKNINWKPLLLGCVTVGAAIYHAWMRAGEPNTLNSGWMVPALLAALSALQTFQPSASAPVAPVVSS